METRHFILDSGDPVQSEACIREAADLLRGGCLVAFPTETVYGLGANALDPVAVARIFEAKQRPSWDPLIVHVTSESMLRRVVAEIPDRARELMRQFWPGPLTMLLPRSPDLPQSVTAGRETVAVRMPSHPVARALIEQAAIPVAAPSANLFGRPSPTTGAHVLSDLSGRIQVVLDAGPTEVGLESTVLGVMENPPVIYRAGAVSKEVLRAILGEVEQCRGSLHAEPGRTPQTLPSPGLGIRHYAPAAQLMLVAPGELASSVKAHSGRQVGIMLPDEIPMRELEAWGATIFRWGSLGDPEALARNLFAGLRALDASHVEVILCPLPEKQGGLFDAIRDRLVKAARDS